MIDLKDCYYHGPKQLVQFGDGVFKCLKTGHWYFTSGTGISTPEDIKNYEDYVSNRS